MAAAGRPSSRRACPAERKRSPMRIECRNISYRYHAESEPIFENLSLCYDQPGFHALFGPSGVGKTTLARIICGEIQPAGGSVTTSRTEPILYTYNLERLPDWATTGRHLERVTPDGRAGLRESLVDIFDIRPCLDQRFGGLSLGQQNRVNLLRYLLQDFGFLIMDESLANVDEKTRETIIMHLKELFRDRMIIYISHNLVEVARFCRQIAVLRSVSKQPRIVGVTGQDLRLEGRPDRTALEKTMLEMMNAA